MLIQPRSRNLGDIDDRSVSSFAKTLTVRVATSLAKEIASLFRPVLQHPVMALTDDDTLSLLTSDFWIRPVYFF